MLSLKYVLNSRLNAISYSKNVQEMTPALAFREKVNSGFTRTCEIYQYFGRSPLPHSGFCTPLVCDIPGEHLQGSKTRNRQYIRAEPQPVSAVVPELFQCWVYFTPLLCRSSNPWVCAIRSAEPMGSTARIQRDIGADCFCSCNRAVAGLTVLYSLIGFNVQSDIFAVLIACS